MKAQIITALAAGSVALGAQAATQVTVSTGTSASDFDADISSVDLLATAVGVDGPDNGWFNSAVTGLTNPQQFASLTDGVGANGFAGLLNDFPAPGVPTKVVTYDLGGTYNLNQINVFTGNPFGSDGRVFSTFRVTVSTDGGVNFNPIEGRTPSGGKNQEGYFESDNLLAVNNTGRRATKVEIANPVAFNVTDIRFEFFSTSNTQGQYQDPFTGVNPYSGSDDGTDAAFESPLVFEVDVFGVVPSPNAAFGGMLGFAAVAMRRRRA